MSPFIELWLPTLLSAVAVFFLSFLVNAVLPWHKNDFAKFPNEEGVMDALRAHNLAPGEYMAPRPEARSDMNTPEFAAKVKRGPLVILNIASGDSASLARPLILWFVYVVIVNALAGHIAYRAVADHDEPHHIFHAVALTAFLAYAAGTWQNTIWFRKPALTSLKTTIDGLIYAVVIGLIFVYFWPKA